MLNFERAKMSESFSGEAPDADSKGFSPLAVPPSLRGGSEILPFFSK